MDLLHWLAAHLMTKAVFNYSAVIGFLTAFAAFWLIIKLSVKSLPGRRVIVAICAIPAVSLTIFAISAILKYFSH